MKYPEFADRFVTAIEEAKPALPARNEDLGKLFGVSGPMISYWRQGDKLPSMDTAIKIANRCGVCVEWLLTGNGPKYPSTAEVAITQAASLVIRAIPELSDNQLELISRMVLELLASQRKADN